MDTAEGLKAENIRVEYSLSIPQPAVHNKSGGIYLSDVSQFSIQNSLFRYLKSSNQAGGGAIYIEESEAAKVQINDGVLRRKIISNSMFENCSSISNGGALAVINVANLEIESTVL